MYNFELVSQSEANYLIILTFLDLDLISLNVKVRLKYLLFIFTVLNQFVKLGIVIILNVLSKFCDGSNFNLVRFINKLEISLHFASLSQD